MPLQTLEILIQNNCFRVLIYLIIYNSKLLDIQIYSIPGTQAMAHLIETIYDTTICKAIRLLESTHALIVECAIAIQKEIGTDSTTWGADIKRIEVPLPYGEIFI